MKSGMGEGGALKRLERCRWVENSSVNHRVQCS
jgi:hypothetical protein